MASVTTGVETNVETRTRSTASVWVFRLSLFFALGWWVGLVGLCLKTANPPLVSHPQVLAARLIVAGTIREAEALPRPAWKEGPAPLPFCLCTVAVVETLHGMPPGEDLAVIVPGLPADWPVGRSAIWPLILSTRPPEAGGDAVWVVVTLPQQRGNPLVYPDRPPYRDLVRDVLAAQPPEADLGDSP